MSQAPLVMHLRLRNPNLHLAETKWELVIKAGAISAASGLQLPAREQQNKPDPKVKILIEQYVVNNYVYYQSCVATLEA